MLLISFTDDSQLVRIAQQQNTLACSGQCVPRAAPSHPPWLETLVPSSCWEAGAGSQDTGPILQTLAGGSCAPFGLGARKPAPSHPLTGGSCAFFASGLRCRSWKHGDRFHVAVAYAVVSTSSATPAHAHHDLFVSQHIVNESAMQQLRN